jgi:hypothetical protein
LRSRARPGWRRDRINTVIAFEAASGPGTKAESSMTATSTAALPRAGTPEKARDAVAELEQRHTLQNRANPMSNARMPVRRSGLSILVTPRAG